MNLYLVCMLTLVWEGCHGVFMAQIDKVKGLCGLCVCVCVCECVCVYAYIYTQLYRVCC